MTNWELAYKDYKDGMKYKDIADKYKVSINTVKSWKSRKWNDIEEGVTPNKKVVHKTKKVAHKEEVQLVIDNDDLTEQQKLFCLLYLQYFNATKAYKEAYQVDFKSAKASGSRLLANVNVKAEVGRLKNELQSDIYLDIKDLIKEYAKQAFADITDFVEFGTKTEIEKVQLDEIEITDEVDENGLPLINDTRTIEHKWSFVNLKESSEIDGTLIQEVKKGRDGVSVKLYDKQKAMDALLKYLDVDGGTADSKVVFIDNEDAMRKELGEYDGTY